MTDAIPAVEITCISEAGHVVEQAAVRSHHDSGRSFSSSRIVMPPGTASRCAAVTAEQQKIVSGNKPDTP